MELLQYLVVLRKWTRLIVVTTLLAALIAAVFSYTSPPSYEAEAQLAIVKSGAQLNFDPRFRSVNDIDTSSDQAARRRSLVLLAKNLDLAAAVIARLGPRLNDRQTDPQVLMNSINVVIDGDLLRVRATSDDPQQAALIANEWVQVYQARVNTIYSEVAVSSTELEAQTKLTQEAFDVKEKEIVSYLASSPLDRISQQIALKQQKASDLGAVEIKLDRLIGDATALRQKIAAGASGNRLGDELAAILIEVNAFNASSTLPSNLFASNIAGSASPPINLQLRLDQFESLTAAEQLRNVDALISTLEDRRKAIRAEASGQLYQEINQLRAQFEQETQRLGAMTRARDVLTTTLVTLMTKLAEVNIAPYTKVNLVRLAAPAAAPMEPLAARRFLNVLLGGAIGLALSAGIALAYEVTHKTVRDEQEASALMDVPILGVIPEMRHNGRSGLFVKNQPRAPSTEAMHLIRHALMASEDDWKVLMVTSALRAEGKSTFAANLAASIAERGRQVVLLDADLRHPTQHVIFGVSNERGLSDLLAGDAADWVAFSQPTVVDGLRLLPSGPLPVDPSGLLAGERLCTLLAVMREAVDVVIVDVPAVLGLADAPVLSSLVDGVVLVVERERVSPQELLSVKAMLSPAQKPLAIVFNRAMHSGTARTYTGVAHAANIAGNGSQTQAPPSSLSGYGTNGSEASLRNRLLGMIVPRHWV